MIKKRIIFLTTLLAMSGGHSNGAILFDGRFDKSNFSDYRMLEVNGKTISGALAPQGIDSRLEKVLDPSGSGNGVMYASYINGDAATSGGYRSELSASVDPIGSERWYSWGYYLPESFQGKKNGVVIAQIHDTPDINESDARNPTLALIAEDDRLKLINVFDYDKITSPYGVASIAALDYERREIASWPLRINEWTFLTLHVKWAGDDTGFLEFWKDGILFFEEKNHPNTFNDERGVWFKSGIYDWSNNPEPSYAYFTGILIGDHRETFQSMSISLIPEPDIDHMLLVGCMVFGVLGFRKHYHMGRV